jgi:hypothetical protein
VGPYDDLDGALGLNGELEETRIRPQIECAVRGPINEGGVTPAGGSVLDVAIFAKTSGQNISMCFFSCFCLLN